MHSYCYLSCKAETTSIHKHSFNMFIIFTNRNYDCRSKMDKITYLKKKSFCNQLCCCKVPPNHRLACYLISQQCCHPQAGHDSPRNKGTTRLTHSQGYTKHSQANTVGFIRASTIQPSQHGQVYQAIQELGKAKC